MRMPRAVSDDLPALALAADLGQVKTASHTIMMAYVAAVPQLPTCNHVYVLLTCTYAPPSPLLSLPPCPNPRHSLPSTTGTMM